MKANTDQSRTYSCSRKSLHCSAHFNVVNNVGQSHDVSQMLYIHTKKWQDVKAHICRRAICVSSSQKV